MGRPNGEVLIFGFFKMHSPAHQYSVFQRPLLLFLIAPKSFSLCVS